MKISELLRLVWMNINQNRFKSVMTSIGIVVGAATIVLVIGIGRGGQAEVAEQFAELNAGAIDISYDYKGEEESSGSTGVFGHFFGGMPGMFGGNGGARQRGEGFREHNRREQRADSGEDASSGEHGGMPEGGMPGGDGAMSGEDEAVSGGDGAMPGGDEAASGEHGGMPEGGMPGGMPEMSGDPESPSAGETEESESETSMIEERMNQEKILLTAEDVEDIELYVSGISGATISYSTRASVEGGDLTSAQTYTVAGVRESYFSVSKLRAAAGVLFTESDDAAKAKVCVLGADVAKELFGSAAAAVGETIYIADRTYSVDGVLASSQTVSSGISPDTAILIPYETGIKYVAGTDIDPVITVIAEDVNTLSAVIANTRTVLEENHVNARFTFEDSGSKMEAAQASHRTLTLLLTAMAAIVFLVGGIGIMNVLFVSVKERTNEIGILKAIGTSRSTILVEFLVEAATISLLGGLQGVGASFLITPLAEWKGVRVEVNALACLAALGFAVLTGTIFGIYPAWKASRLEPVEALNAE